MRKNGSALLAVFAAIATLGVIGAGLNTIMRGPVSTMADVTKRTVAENNMIASSKLAVVMAPTVQANNGDCDADGFVEPLPYRDAGSGPKPVGGGYLPTAVGASLTDPWQTQYGYCVWDAGPKSVPDNIAACGGTAALRLKGAPNNTQMVVTIISAGKDRTFQTTCNAYADANNDNLPDTPLVVKAGGSDDIVMGYTYAEANNVTGNSLWNLKTGTPTTAQIAKDIEVQGTANFSGGLKLGGGLVLAGDPGNNSVTGPCNAANDQQLRRNTSTNPQTLEICNFSGGATGWTAIGANGTNGTNGSGGGGGGMTTGMIVAFATASCPDGWSEYTLSRGRFLRGRDNGAGLDPDGSRAAGSVQADAFQNFTGGFKLAGSYGGLDSPSGAFYSANGGQGYPSSTNSYAGSGAIGFDASLVARTSTETRPKNVAVTYCQYSGTGGVSSSSGSSTAASSFSVDNGGSTQSVSANTWTTVAFANKQFDTDSAWSTASNRFTPKVAGKYLINGAVYCQGGPTVCAAAVYKNGAYTVQGATYNVAGNVIGPVTAIIDMNGTTDYIDLRVYTSSSSIGNGTGNHYLQGALLGGGGSSSSSAGTTMVPNFPDAIMCNYTGGSTNSRVTLYNYSGDTSAVYQGLYNGVYYQAIFGADGSYSSSSNLGGGTFECRNKSITQLYANNQAFNFVGGGSSSSSSSVTASSGPSFSVNKGGTNQSVSANTYTTITWSNELFDTNNNFASNRFTPTVAGKYLFNLSVYGNTNNVYATIAKNGTRIGTGWDNTAIASYSTIVDMNGTTDYVEAQTYTNGGTIRGDVDTTNFSGALIAPIAGTGDNLGNHTATQALAMANNKITGLATPTVATDAATKGYVDGLTGADSWIASRTGYVSGQTSATSGTWTTVPGLTITFTLARAAKVNMLFNGELRGSQTGGANIHAPMRFVIDGTPTGDATFGDRISLATSYVWWNTFTNVGMTNLAAGSHTISAQVNPFYQGGANGVVCGELDGSLPAYTNCNLKIIATY